MFAFIAIDLKTREFIAARDPFGEKPLYLIQSGAAFLFCSEIRPLLQAAETGDVLLLPPGYALGRNFCTPFFTLPAPDSAAIDSTTPLPFGEVLRRHEIRLVTDLAGKLTAPIPTGAVSLPARSVTRRISCRRSTSPNGSGVVLSIAAESGAGVLVVGLNRFRLFDGNYRDFLGLVAGQLAAAVANADAFEQERQRAEALAEIDRVKTNFFSNVSHEFRTPLTLMLGPLEEAMSEAEALPERFRERMQVVHRNGLRLLKSVNSLLDFSRIEAGRARANYEPTDLATLTEDIVSNFRSATEKAGLELQIDCPTLPEPVYVDRDMWEKIVLNLVSNAFKFTFEGGIRVDLKVQGRTVELGVHDTGTGIPAAELPRLFERFHRIDGARGRSFEGSGIGLALGEGTRGWPRRIAARRESRRPRHGFLRLLALGCEPFAGGSGARRARAAAARRRRPSLCRRGAPLAAQRHHAGARRSGGHRRRFESSRVGKKIPDFVGGR